MLVTTGNFFLKKIEIKFYYIYANQSQFSMPRKLTECSNCSNHFEAHYPYCPYCGQKANDDLTLGVLFNNTINNYFSVDARFFRSFIPLMLKPGYLAKRFVEGKRLLYLHPAQMYLFVSVVFFFLFSFISRQQVQSIDSALKSDIERSRAIKDSIDQKKQDSIILQEAIKPFKDNQQQLGISDESMKVIDSTITNNKVKNTGFNGKIGGVNFNETAIDSMIQTGASDVEIYKFMGMNDDDGIFTKRMYKQVLKFFKNKSGGSILQAFYDSIPLAMFILLPIFAFLLKIFYFNKGRFAYHLVFTFYFFAFLFIVFGWLVFATLVWKDFPTSIIALVMLSTYFYLFLGVKRFYEQGYFLSFIKSGVITSLFLMMVLPFAAIIVGLMAFLFY
ncbi:hypothetical protein GCM10011531_14320 [Aquaticitalea lipolytica]|uniref:DUF3667 domain-containing protein n=1 Tax=Aquaticitalea lipolytica TaxID=1247562 RepID=A0A8J2TPP5_9FLAO|nr:DUF3667 domain-containing protein [Aquaticitalea lipolytica]GFZ84633.1 hypothetical protein GCM10011531_14320 [Aquaticitalea lipolytica]